MNVARVLRILTYCCLTVVSLNYGESISQELTAPTQSSTPVTVYFTIAAKAAVPLSAGSLGLTASIENRPAQIVALHSAKEDALVYAVLIDRSSSNAKAADQIRSAAGKIFRALADRGQGYCGAFDVELKISQRPVSPAEVDSALTHMQFGGGTALFDALWKTSSDTLSRQRVIGVSRRILVVISDGDDNQSHTYLKEAIATAEREGIAIFAVATSSQTGKGWEVLANASRETGGRAVQGNRLEDEIGPLLAAIDSQWVLSLNTAQPPDQKLYTLKLKSTLHGISITAPAEISLQ